MNIKSMLSALTDKYVISILFLGFASGLPIALTASTLNAWYTEAGLSLLAIGSLSLIGQPYVYKFLWSPLIDRYDVPCLTKRLGHRRSWMLVFQILLVFAIASMAFFNPKDDPRLLAFLAFIVATLSASQDISINAYQTDIAQGERRGLVAAAISTGWRIAVIISGALAMIMAQVFGWHVTYLAMSALMIIGIITTLVSPTPEHEQTQNLQDRHGFWISLIEPIIDFFQRYGVKTAIILLISLIIYKLGDAFALSLNTTFLLRGMQFSLADVGTVNKVGGMSASIIGSIIGGLWMTRLGLFRSLIIFGVIQNVGNLAFMWLAIAGHHYPIMIFSVLCENFCSGLGNTGFVALLMTMCNQRFSASQYALLSALTAIGRIYIGPMAGILVEQIGWAWFYFFSMAIGFPGVALLFLVKRHIPK